MGSRALADCPDRYHPEKLEPDRLNLLIAARSLNRTLNSALVGMRQSLVTVGVEHKSDRDEL